MSDMNDVYKKAKALGRANPDGTYSGTKKKNPMKYELSPEESDELSKMFPKENSREQYNMEKKAGAPLTDLSYDKWKKL